MNDQGGAVFLSIFASLVVTFTNDGLIRFVRRFTDFEKHQTITKINVSVAVKLTIARFLNQSLILVLVNKETRNWFTGGSLAYDATTLMVSAAIQAPLMYVINIPGRLKQRKIDKEMEKEKSEMTQQEANTLCEGPTIDVANNISKFMAFLMTCIFYSPIVPVAIPIGFVGCICIYFSYKYMLLRVHKMPEMFGELMATFFANFMPVILVVWAIAYTTFITEINRTYADDFSREHAKDGGIGGGDDRDGAVVAEEKLSDADASGSLAEAVLFISICFLLCPVRTLIYKFKKEVEEESNAPYKDMALTFPSDYDMENPLTMSEGKTRRMDIAIEQAVASGVDEEQIA